MATGAELTYNTNASALAMANTIFGNGVTVVGASTNVAQSSTSTATYSNGQLAPGVVPANSGVILSTGDARAFTQSSGDPNRSTQTSTNTAGTDNNPDFNAIAGATTYDGVWLNADFIPTGNYMTMQFVFSSEEYPEYINSQYNDVVGVWVNGVHVPIEVGNGTTSVNNINTTNQENLVRSNMNDAFNTEMDGFTIRLTLVMQVNPGVVNSIRIGIADTSDSQYDSNLLIGADSVQTRLVARTDTVTMFPTQAPVTIAPLANDISQPGSTLTITHINGVAVVAGQTVTLPSGQQVTLNANGTFTIQSDGQIEQKTFTYDVQDNLGNTATGFVTVNQIPCFVAGTRIRTPRGEVPVETLRPGDLVLTHDDGPQPLRWIGMRTVPAEGAMAPVHIRAGTFGRHGALRLSPQHRVLVRDGLADLLFGEAEVLVAAKDLVNGRSITQRPGGEVTYVHLLFDRHQVVWSEGLATESFLPGPQTAAVLDDPAAEELRRLFPDLDPGTGEGYGPSARRALKPHEAQVLFGQATAA
jgi:hypothetical protein